MARRDQSPLIDTRQFCRLLGGISTRTFYRWRPFLTVGPVVAVGRPLWDRAQVLAALETGRLFTGPSQTRGRRRRQGAAGGARWVSGNP